MANIVDVQIINYISRGQDSVFAARNAGEGFSGNSGVKLAAAAVDAVKVVQCSMTILWSEVPEINIFLRLATAVNAIDLIRKYLENKKFIALVRGAP